MAAEVFELDEDVDAVVRGRDGVGRASATLSAARRRFSQGVASTVAAWSGPRSEVFDAAGHGTAALLANADSACRHADAVLGDLARAVRRADDELSRLRAHHDALPPHLLLPGAAPPGLSGDVQRRADALVERAGEVKRDLAGSEGRAASALDSLTDRVSAHLTALPAGQVARRVTVAAAEPVGATGGSAVDRALTVLTGALLVGPDGRIGAEPDSDSSPIEVRRWWTALDPDRRDLLLRSRPAHFGNLDGVPVLERDLANRIVLVQELTRLEAEERARFPNGEPPRWRTVHQGYDLGTVRSVSPEWRAWDDLHQRLAGAWAIRARLASGAEPAYLLVGFQPRVGAGRAILSQGDPDTAADTSVFVAGTTARLDALDLDVPRSEVMRRAAIDAGADDDRLATVTWYGYDAPPTVAADARTLGFAERGAPLLRRFAAGLRATHDPASRSHTTAVGHSYGTTVVGWAASHGHRLDVDDVVLVASPGVGVGHGWLHDDATVDDLHLSGPSRGHVYATRSRADIIKWVVDTHLGVDPTRPSFGARVFGADPVDGHDDYWHADSDPAVLGMGAVIAGAPVSPPTPRQDVHPPVDVSIAPGL